MVFPLQFQIFSQYTLNFSETIIQILMKEQDSQEIYCQEKPSKYKRVTNHARNKLIQKVVFEGKKVVSMAKVLRINPSTAKMIILRYKKKLRLEERSLSPLISPVRQEPVAQKGAEISNQRIQEFDLINDFPGYYFIYWMPIVGGYQYFFLE